MFLKVLKASGITLLTLVVLLFLVASPPPFTAPLIQPVRALLVSVVTKAVSQSMNGTLEVEAVEGSLWSAPVARGISLTDAQGELVVRLDTLSLRYRLADLFQGRLQIQELIITRPQLWLAWDEHGQLNLAGVFPSDPSDAPDDASLPISINLERVSVQSGAVDLALPSLPGMRKIEDLSLELSGEIEKDELRLAVQRGSAQLRPAAVNLEALQGTLSIEAGRTQLEAWLLKTGTSRISMEGVILGDGQPASLQLDMDPLDVGELGRLLGEQLLQGDIRGVMHAEGPAESLELDSRLTAGAGEILLSGTLDTHGPVPRYRSTLELTKFDLSHFVAGDALRSDINATLQVHGSGLSGPDFTGELDLLIASSRIGDVAIEPSEVRIAAEAERVRIQTFQIRTSAFTAALEGEIDLAGRSALDYRVAVELENLRGLIDANALAGEGQLSGRVGGSWPDTYIDGALEASGIVFDDAGVQALDLRYRVDGLKRGPTVAFTLKAHTARFAGMGIQAVTGEAEYSFGDDGQRAQFVTRLTQSPSVEANLKGVLTSVGQRSELTLEKVGVRLEGHVWDNTVPLRLSFMPDSFFIEPFRLVHGDESIEASGGLKDGRFQELVLRANNIDLSVLSRIADLPMLETSRGDLAADLTGTIEAPVFEAEVTLRTGHDQSPLFEQAGLHLSYAQDRFEGEAYVAQNARRVLTVGLELPVHLALKAMPIEERLVDAPLAVNLDIDRPELETLSVGLPKMPALGGTFRGRFDVAGSYTNLTIDSDLEFEGVDVTGVIEGIRGPLGFKASVETAPSLEALRQALAEDFPGLALRSLEARSSRIEAVVPANEASRQLILEDLVLEANGLWDSSGITGEVPKFRALAAVAGYPDTELALAAVLSEERLQFENLSATTGASEIQGEGGISLDDERIAFEWRITGLELREFVSELPQSFPSVVSGRVDVKGTMQEPELSTWLEYAGATLTAQGKLGLAGERSPSYEADLRLSQLDLARFYPDLQGEMTASMNLQGVGFSGDDREVKIQAAIDSNDLGPAPELKGRLQAEVVGQTLDVEALRLQSTAFEVQAQGVLSKTQTSDFGYRLTVRDLASLHGYVPGDLQVRGTLDGKISGDQGTLNNVSTLKLDEWRFADWQGGEVNAELKIDDLMADPQAIAKADITDLQGPRLANTALRFDGTYRSGQGDFSLAVTEGPFARSLFAGELSTEKGVQGTVSHFLVQHDDWVWENTGPIQIASDVTGAVTVDNLNIASAEQRISAGGSWSPDGKIAGEARIDGLQIKPVLNALALGRKEMSGLVDADLTIRGTLEQPRVDASMQATALRWRQQGLGEIEARISMAGSVLTGSARWLDQHQALLTLEGRLDTGASNTIDVEVLAPDLDLSVLQPLSQEILHSDGRLRLDLALSGTLNHPQARGSLELRDGELQLAALGEVYTGIQSRLGFSGTRMVIEQFKVNSHTGVAELNGWMETAGLSLGQLDLKLSTDNFTVLDTPAYSAVVSSDIALRGSGEDLMVSGEVEVVRARLRYESLPSTGPPGVEPWELTVEGVFGAGPPDAAAGIGQQSTLLSAPNLPFLRTDIQVSMPGNSWVQGGGTAVEIGGDVRVTKAHERPFIVVGEVNTLRGFATFFGKKFIVEKGRITFTGSEEIDPILDVEASHQVSEYTAYVGITGNISEPVISFRSTPELEESDIISLLVFGRTFDQLSSSEQSSVGNQTMRMAGRLAAGVLERHVGEVLGLDTIAVGLGGDTTSTSLGAGRYVTQDLFLFYERTFRDPRQGNRSGNTVGIEKRLNERQTLKATGSDLGETAVDWLWRYDY